MSGQPVRAHGETRGRILQVALDLFSTKGYEATSLREIAETLGIRKASLYYHFPSKGAIVEAIVANRADEAAELLAWARAQPPGPDLVRRVIMRWVESMSAEKLRGIRLLNANPALLRSIAAGEGQAIGDSLGAVAEVVTADEHSATRRVLTRMALLSINAAASAAEGTASTDEGIIAAARAAADAIVGYLERSAPATP